MKVIKSLILIVISTFVLASCSKSDSYLNVIPSESTLVVSVDMKAIAEKGDLGHSSLVGLMNQYMGFVLNGEAGKKVKAYMEKPEQMGIDFREPVYVFQTPSHCLGLTMKMLDKGDFEDFVQLLQKQNLASKTKERDGVMRGTLLDDIEYGYDGNTILILASIGGEAQSSRQLLPQLFAQKPKDSFVAAESYERRFVNSAKDIEIFSNLAVLPSNIANAVRTLLPNGIKTTDIQMECAVDFENGRAVLNGALVPTSDKARKALAETEQNLHTINGDYIESALECFPLWACMGVNGEWMLGKLKQNPSVKQTLFMIERGIDIEAMIRAVDGDVSIAMPKVDEPLDFMVNARVKNSDFMADVADWQAGMKEYGISMQKKDANSYVLQAEDLNLIWGVKDNNLNFTTVGAMASMLLPLDSPKQNSTISANADEIKKSKVYVYLDLQSVITPMVQSSSAIDFSPQAIAIKKFSSKFKSLTLRLESMDNIGVRVELNDDKENFLKELL